MRTELTDAETLVAPQEVRELLQRLTEQSVEAVDASEIRTLGGLAARTGIPIERLRKTLDQIRGRRPRLAWFATGVGATAIFWVVYDATRPKPPVLIPPPPVTTTLPVVVDEADRSGLVSLDAVTYGPDSGFHQVDPSFVPSVPLPPGISVSVQYKDVLWGTGDHRATALQKPFSAAQEAQIRRSTEELIRYALEQAKARKLVGKDMTEIVLSGMTNTYNGMSSGSGAFPTGSDEGSKLRTDSAVRKLARELIDRLQEQLEMRRKMEFQELIR